MDSGVNEHICPQASSTSNEDRPALRDAQGSALSMSDEGLDVKLDLGHSLNARATFRVGSVKKPILSLAQLMEKRIPI